MLKPLSAILILYSAISLAAPAPAATNLVPAGNKVESAPVIAKVNASSPTIAAQNLEGIDKTSRDILDTNRQIELAKKKNELRKEAAGGEQVSSSTGGAMNTNSQTTVLGVSINGAGKRFATLQFADGGTLDVELGSKVGKYIVKDIVDTIDNDYEFKGFLIKFQAIHGGAITQPLFVIDHYDNYTFQMYYKLILQFYCLPFQQNN